MFAQIIWRKVIARNDDLFKVIINQNKSVAKPCKWRWNKNYFQFCYNYLVLRVMVRGVYHLAVRRSLLPLTITNNNCVCRQTHLEIFCHKYSVVRTYIPGKNVWNGVRKSSKAAQGYKTLITSSVYFLTAIFNFLFWGGGDCLHSNLRFF